MDYKEIINRLRNQLKPKPELPTLEDISKTLEYRQNSDYYGVSYIEGEVTVNGVEYWADIYDSGLYNALEFDSNIEDYYNDPRTYFTELILGENKFNKYK